MDDSGVSGEARDLAESGLVLGKPVSAGKVTVIPVIQAWVTVADLFGAGGVHFASARVKPAAVVIVNGDKVDVVAIGNEPEPSLTLETVRASLPEMMGRVHPGDDQLPTDGKGL